MNRSLCVWKRFYLIAPHCCSILFCGILFLQGSPSPQTVALEQTSCLGKAEKDLLYLHLHFIYSPPFLQADSGWGKHKNITLKHYKMAYQSTFILNLHSSNDKTIPNDCVPLICKVTQSQSLGSMVAAQKCFASGESKIEFEFDTCGLNQRCGRRAPWNCNKSHRAQFTIGGSFY